MAQWLVTATGIADECGALALDTCEGGVEQVLGVLPAIAIGHADDPGALPAAAWRTRRQSGDRPRPPRLARPQPRLLQRSVLFNRSVSRPWASRPGWSRAGY